MAMTLSPPTDDGWELLGSHQGLVRSLVWSSDGAGLFSGSADGEIRKWTDRQYVTLRPPGDGAVFDMAWCSRADQLIAGLGSGVAVYGPTLVHTAQIAAQAISCDPGGSYAALREWVSGEKNQLSRPRLRLRSTQAIETPRLDSDVFQRSGERHYDFARRPDGGLLAVLADGEVSFVSSLTERVLE